MESGRPLFQRGKMEAHEVKGAGLGSGFQRACALSLQIRALYRDEAARDMASQAQAGAEGGTWDQMSGPEGCQVTRAELAGSPALHRAILRHLSLTRPVSSPGKERGGPGPMAGILG